MSKYSTLKAEIIASIKRNGAQAITGDLLQEKLLAMIDSLGEFYQFGGLALPSTEFTPGDEPVVFIAATPGTYTNFGGLVVADGEVALLVWSGSAWSKQTTDIATRSEVSQLGQYENNPEYVNAVVDGERKILEATTPDNKKIFTGSVSIKENLEIDGNSKVSGNLEFNSASIDGNSTMIQETPEYIKAITDSEGKIIQAIKPDGASYVGGNLQVDGELIISSQNEGDTILDTGYISSLYTVENPEFYDVKTDADGKIIASIKKDGVFEIPLLKSPVIDTINKILNKYIDTSAIVGNEIDSIEYYGTPEVCLSVKDASVTTYDNINIGFIQVLKISSNLYYLYYNAMGTDSSRDPETGQWDADSYRNMTKLAYSTDGINWTRGYPSGITPPPTGDTNCIQFYEGEIGSYRAVYDGSCIFKANWDAEYPFRAVTLGAEMKLFKSKDGVSFTNAKVIDKTWRDTQPDVIIRGNVLKIYNRVRPANGRYIAVAYTDLDGNVLSPSRYLFGEDGNYNTAAAPLDDRREILFPTKFVRHIGTIYPYDVQGIECYIVDGNRIIQVPLDSELLLENGDVHSIYATGLVDVNGEQYLYYSASNAYHDVEVLDPTTPGYFSEVRRVKIGFGNNEQEIYRKYIGFSTTQPSTADAIKSLGNPSDPELIGSYPTCDVVVPALPGESSAYLWFAIPSKMISDGDKPIVTLPDSSTTLAVDSQVTSLFVGNVNYKLFKSSTSIDCSTSLHIEIVGEES